MFALYNYQLTSFQLSNKFVRHWRNKLSWKYKKKTHSTQFISQTTEATIFKF